MIYKYDMAKCSSPYLSCDLYFNPFSYDENIAALNTFSKVIRTCIGPRGKLKLIKNRLREFNALTSSSERLFSSIIVKNSFSKLIISCAKSQIKTYKDGGLQCALLTLSLIDNFSLNDIPAMQLVVLYDYFIKSFTNCLKSEDNLCILKIDFSNLQILESVVKTILSSKPGCLLSQNDRNHLCKLLLEAFLNIFPNSSRILDNFNITFLTFGGNSVRKSELFNDLLVQVPKLDCMSLKNDENVSAKAALFTVSFAGDEDFKGQELKVSHGISVMEGILKHLQSLVNKIISQKISIVFFQKVIHPRLKKQLQDAGVAVFEQLGCKTAAFLQYLLGGSANSSLFAPLSSETISYTQKSIEGNHYLLLHSDQNPFCSLLIYSYNEEVLLELEVVCNQVISSLVQLLKTPRVCFGAGCTEIYTLLMLIRKTKDNLLDIASELGCTQRIVLSSLKNFSQGIIDVAISSHQKSRLDLVVDTTYGHLWEFNDGDPPNYEETCTCGCYSFSSLKSPKMHFLYDIENLSFEPTENFLNNGLNFKNLVLDLLNTKITSYTSGCETAILLLKTNMCISTESSMNKEIF